MIFFYARKQQTAGNTNLSVPSYHQSFNMGTNFTFLSRTTILSLLTAFLLLITSAGWGQTTIAGWNMSAQTTFGTSPLSATTTATNTTIGSLTKGSGFATGGTAAGRAWGYGTSTTAASTTSTATAITNNSFFTFTVKPNAGYTLSLSAISAFDYRRSGTGAANGLLQYQINSGSFVDIGTINFTVTTSTGGSIGSTDLSGISALQNLSESSTVTFRCVLYNGTTGGTWYIFDKSNTTANDFVLTGTVSAVAATPTISSSGTLAAVNTTYGTASASPTSFSVSGTNMSAGITVTPPAGFEVSTSSSFASGIGTNASPITVGSSGTIASTTVYVRLAATTTVGSYSGNIVLSSSGASSVNVATASSTVSAKTLTITGLTGVDKIYDGTTTATTTGTATLSGVLAGDVSNVTLGGTPVINFASATVGNAKAITITGYSISGSASGNYSLTQPTGLTANITKATPTITADPTASSITDGQTLASSTLSGGTASVAGSFDWTTPGTVPSLGTSSQSVTFTPTDGTNYNTTSTTVSITVNAAAFPTLTPVTLGSALSTTYGTASSGVSFTASGSALSDNITATAQTGYQVSTDDATYSSSVSVASGTTVYVRFAATRVPGSFNAATAVVLSSAGATNVDVTTSASGNTVSTKTLTVTGLTAQNKVYDGLTTATTTGTAVLSGVLGSDVVTLTGTPGFSFATAAVGAGKAITTTGYTLGGANASYYLLTQPSFTADITVRSLTVTANNVSKYAGVALTGGAGSTAFTSSGLQNSETIGSVTIAYGSAGAATGDGNTVGVYASQVTPSAATGGTFTSSNYSISYVAGSITVNEAPVTLAAWDFTTASPSSSNSNLTVSAVSQGNNNGTTTLISGTSVSSGYTGASAGNNAAAAARAGSLNTATSGSAYFEFTITANEGTQVTLTDISFGSRGTTTAPQAFTLRSSADSYATDIFTSSLTTNSTWTLRSNSTQLNETLSSSQSRSYRIYGYNGTGSPSANTANWRIDDLKLMGFVSSLPSLTDPTATSITTTSAILGATISSNGGSSITARGTVYGTAASPTGNAVAEGGTSTGAFSHSRTGLTANTLYYYRGYATNSMGTGYSADGTFTTLPLAPTVGTGTSVTSTSFVTNWSHPTMGAVSYTYTVEVDDNSDFSSVDKTVSGISSSSTSQSITLLTPSTTYYFRVKAVNTQGSSDWSSTSAGVTTSAAPVTSPEINLKQGATDIASGGAYDFGSVLASSSSAAITFTIENTGDGDLNLTAMPIIAISGTNASDFTVNQSATTSPVAPSSSTTFTITFSPTTTGAKTGTITIINDDANESTYTFSITGTATAATQPTAQPTSFTRSAVSTTGMTIGWTAATGSPDGYIVLRTTASGTTYPNTDPVDGTTYTAGGTLGNATVMYVGSSLSAEITGLVAATQYSYEIYSYNGSGGSINYFVTSPLQGQPFTLATEPTTQATPSTGTRTATSIQVTNFNGGGGASVMIIAKQGSAVDAFPVDGQTYTANAAFGSGSDLGGGNFVVGINSSDPLTVTGLTAATTYHFATVDYNGTLGTTANFLTTSPGTASASTLAAEPTTIASSVTLTARTNNSIALSWTNGNGANRIVVARTSGTSATAPTDGTSYTVNSASYADGSNGTTASGRIVVYNGSGNSVTVTGLNAGASYSFDVYEYNGSSTSTNYAAAGSLTTQYTLSNEPAAHAATFTATVASATSINLGFSAASTIPASGYLLLKKSSAFVSGDYPADGSAYAVGASVGSATVNTVVTSNATTTATGTSVVADGTYYYLLVPFNWDGSNNATRNYYTGGTIPSANANTPSAVNDAVAVSSSESATISSLTNTAAPLSSTTGTQVWQFTIRDGGSTLNDNDALPTNISSVVLTENASSTVASWFTTIKSVGLFDGSTLLATGTVGNPTDNITFSGLTLSIPDGQSKTLSVRISLNNTLGATDDGKRFVFNLTNSNIATASDGTSSTFPAAGSINSATTSANIITVVATKLAFVQQPSNVNISATMSPSVTVEAEDANGNRDLDYVTSVSITSTGTLTGSPLAATPVSGIATFSNIVHTASATEAGRELTASSGSLTSATSNTFNVVFAPVTLYQHNFGTTTINTHPYTGAPQSFDANLSSSSWSNSGGTWTSFAGSAGQALALSNVSSGSSWTLTFNVASGYQASITSFDFWRQRSASGPTNWSMTINGISVGSGTTPTTGAAVGSTNVTNSVSAQTGTITVVLSFTGGTGGSFRLDDFTLNGNVTCLTPSDKTVAAASASVCLGSSTNITVSSSTIGVNYQLRNDADDSNIGSAVAGTGGTINLPTGNLTEETTFNVLATNSAGTCSPSPLQLTNTPTVSINALPTALVLTGSSICTTPGGNGTITSSTSVVGVNYQLYNSSNAVVQSAKAGTGSGLTWSSLAAGNGYYVAAIDATTGCTATSNTGNITNISNGSAPTPGNNSRCGTGTVSLSVSGAGGTYTWYSDAGLTTQVGTGTSYTTPSISTTTNYYVTETNGSGCASVAATVTATINANPSAPTAGNNSRCGVGNVTISATPGSGQTIDWYAASSTGSVLSGGLATTSYVASSLTSTTSYYAEARNTTTGCVSASRTTVTATINSVQTISLSSGSASQTPTINTAITNIVYAVGGGATGASASPLPNGVSGNFSSGTYTISGTPTETGTFNYTVTTSPANGCTASLSGNIVVSAAPASTANYRTKQSGLFTDVSTWEYYDGSGWQNASAVPIYPTGTNNIEVVHALTLNVNYTVGSSKTFEISTGTMTINPGYRFSVNNTTANAVNFGGRSVVLKSDASGTASIGTIGGSGTALTGATNVTIERYMQARRKWRAMTAPLTGTSNNSIYYNWQNNGNISSGTGVVIWSPGSDEFATGVAAGGFSSSLLKLDNATNSWQAVTNTKSEALFDETSNKGFMLYFTGPYNQSGTYITTGTLASTLSANGTLRKGDINFSSLASGWHMIGNPYASSIRTNALSITNLNTNGYVWNPGGAGTGVFLPITLGVANTIQSGQAFFVYSTGSGALGFTESAKIAGSSNSYFRSEENPIEGDLKIELNKYAAGNTELSDVAIINYKSRAEAGLPKLAQFYENMSIYQDNADYGMTTRTLNNGEDNIQLRLWQMNKANYQIKIDLSGMKLPAGSTAVLKDAFLNKEITLSTTEANKVDFSVDGNAASSGQRYRIVIRRGVVPVTSTETPRFHIYPNPVEKGSSMQLEFRNQEAGKYEVTVYSMTGMAVQKSVLRHNGGTYVQPIQLDQRLSSGNYLVEITGEAGMRKQVKLTIQ